MGVENSIRTCVLAPNATLGCQTTLKFGPAISSEECYCAKNLCNKNMETAIASGSGIIFLNICFQILCFSLFVIKLH